MCHASSLPQMVNYKTLERWGQSGFNAHVAKVAQSMKSSPLMRRQIRGFYADQCRALQHALALHLTGLAEWNAPEAGMFLWIKLLVRCTFAVGEKCYGAGRGGFA